MDNNIAIQNFYNADPGAEDDRLNRHQLEFDMTWRYFDEYLPKSGHILEIGCATGVYTVGLAQKGYQVTAVDMSAELLNLCQANLDQAGCADSVQIVQADARDLSEITKQDFDAVLLMGPLYHLFEEAERKQAIQEGYDRLRPGGVFYSAHISKFGIMGNLIWKHPNWMEDKANLDHFLANGYMQFDKESIGFQGYFATVPEVAPLHESVGLETIALAGIEPGISDDDASYNQLEGETRKQWLELFFEMSTIPSIIGASRHLLYVGRKL